VIEKESLIVRVIETIKMVLHEKIEQRISASAREKERFDGEELCGEEWNHRFFPAQFGLVRGPSWVGDSIWG
jgi:hypothetical protein